MVDAKQVEHALEEIAVLLGLSGGERFRAQAYERGAAVVRALGGELGDVIAERKLTEIEGIGPGLAKHIDELYRTGRSELLEKLRSEHPKGAAELARVPGVTPKRLRALAEGLHITSVEQLREACVAHRVQALAGFGPKTERALLDAIDTAERREAGPTRLRLDEALSLATRLASRLEELSEVREVAIAGAVRRREPLVSAIELVCVGTSREHVLGAVAALPGVAGVDRERGEARLTEGVPLRVFVPTEADAGAELLAATGPEAHVRELAARTVRTVSVPAGGDLVAREARVYASLGLAWVAPELRHRPDAIDAATSGAFATLLETSDVRGFVHCHTTFSDGRNTVLEMARAAEALGMQYITITDHSPAAHYARGVTLDRLKEQWDAIDEAQARVSIRILRGTESDILVDGALDYPDSVLERFDVVVASIHSRFRQGRADMTRRLVRAMELPIFKIWGHALGRLLLEREAIDCDVDAVLDAFTRAPGAIEVNGDPRRLDLPPEWIPRARARGIPFVVSVDAHSVDGLGVLPYAVMMARRGGLLRDDVLNTLDADAFAERVRPAGPS